MKYKGKEIVITAKLDGENIHMNQKDCYARSDGAPTRSPWSRNIWDPQFGLYWKIQKYWMSLFVLLGLLNMLCKRCAFV